MVTPRRTRFVVVIHLGSPSTVALQPSASSSETTTSPGFHASHASSRKARRYVTIEHLPAGTGGLPTRSQTTRSSRVVTIASYAEEDPDAKARMTSSGVAGRIEPATHARGVRGR